jgi:ABC-type protease/lipase transport system fused ATPase/permease subunit
MSRDTEAPPLEGADALVRVRQRIRAPFVAVAIFSLVINVLALTVPIYMTQVYDRVLTSYSLETLAMLSGLALGCSRCSSRSTICGARSSRGRALRAEQTLRQPLFAAVTDPARGPRRLTLPLRDLAALRGFATSPWSPRASTRRSCRSTSS